jgi:hypothetical protein
MLEGNSTFPPQFIFVKQTNKDAFYVFPLISKHCANTQLLADGEKFPQLKYKRKYYFP